jgi:hypothetical protein
MKYKRLLSANHYNGCNDRLARAIDTMAGLIPDTLQEIPKYEWRGMSREINSRLDEDYKRRTKK